MELASANWRTYPLFRALNHARFISIEFSDFKRVNPKFKICEDLSIKEQYFILSSNS